MKKFLLGLALLAISPSSIAKVTRIKNKNGIYSQLAPGIGIRATKIAGGSSARPPFHPIIPGGPEEVRRALSEDQEARKELDRQVEAFKKFAREREVREKEAIKRLGHQKLALEKEQQLMREKATLEEFQKELNPRRKELILKKLEQEKRLVDKRKEQEIERSEERLSELKNQEIKIKEDLDKIKNELLGITKKNLQKKDKEKRPAPIQKEARLLDSDFSSEDSDISAGSSALSIHQIRTDKNASSPPSEKRLVQLDKRVKPQVLQPDSGDLSDLFTYSPFYGPNFRLDQKPHTKSLNPSSPPMRSKQSLSEKDKSLQRKDLLEKSYPKKPRKNSPSQLLGDKAALFAQVFDNLSKPLDESLRSSLSQSEYIQESDALPKKQHINDSVGSSLSQVTRTLPYQELEILSTQLYPPERMGTLDFQSGPKDTPKQEADPLQSPVVRSLDAQSEPTYKRRASFGEFGKVTSDQEVKDPLSPKSQKEGDREILFLSEPAYKEGLTTSQLEEPLSFKLEKADSHLKPPLTIEEQEPDLKDSLAKNEQILQEIQRSQENPNPLPQPIEDTDKGQDPGNPERPNPLPQPAGDMGEEQKPEEILTEKLNPHRGLKHIDKAISELDDLLKEVGEKGSNIAKHKESLNRIIELYKLNEGGALNTHIQKIGRANTKTLAKVIRDILKLLEEDLLLPRESLKPVHPQPLVEEDIEGSSQPSLPENGYAHVLDHLQKKLAQIKAETFKNVPTHARELAKYIRDHSLANIESLADLESINTNEALAKVEKIKTKKDIEALINAILDRLTPR